MADAIIEHASSVPDEAALGIKGLTRDVPPLSLLANLGQMSMFEYDVDILVCRQIELGRQ